jgi:hypothetical protein
MIIHPRKVRLVAAVPDTPVSRILHIPCQHIHAHLGLTSEKEIGERDAMSCCGIFPFEFHFRCGQAQTVQLFVKLAGV